MTEEIKQEEETLKGGSYDILRQRLLTLDETLAGRLQELNTTRRGIFGATDLKLEGEDRIATNNNCVPRDIISAGDLLIFGYNVFVGLRSAMNVTDVLSAHRFNGTALPPAECPAFQDKNFVRDFQDLYRYYKNACFLQFLKQNGHLLMIFQNGETVNDIKVFRFNLDKDGVLTYIDNRGDSEYTIPRQHFFEWKQTTRENQISGKHPHINIEDTVFVECIEGDLTIKVENNTGTGQGIYSEPVDDPDQALGDAFIYYTRIEGMLFLKIKPFGENNWRYFVFNTHFSTVKRIDSIEQACVPLPEGQGFIFPQGCYLQDGSIRLFDCDTNGMFFLECIKSPNGEDFMYVFYNAVQGRHIIFTYNLISKETAPPLICHGYSLFDDGRMVIFSDPDGEARRNHPMQIWQTPFYADSYSTPAKSEGYLSLIGNRSLVRGISEGFGISRLIHSEPVTVAVYQEIIRDTRKMLDAYYWLNRDECGNIAKVVEDIRATAIAAVGEYEKVLRIKSEHNERLRLHEEEIANLRTEIATGSASDNIDTFVRQLDSLRACRGNAVTLRDLKYLDKDKLSEDDKLLEQLSAQVSQSCLDRLLEEDGLAPYKDALAETESRLANVTLLVDCSLLQKELDATAARLDLLTSTVNNLDISDATRAAAIVDRITELYANVNRLRANAKNKARSLGEAEAKIDFVAQFKLLSQSVSNHIGIADTAAKCEEALTRTLVTIEELEGKFSDYEDFLERLTAKREEIIAAFNTKKQQLNEARQRRADHLCATAARILKGIQSRAASLKDAPSLNACFTTDSMAVKFADCVKAIRELGESVQADDLQGKLHAARDEAIRHQRDKEEIFEDDGETANLGGRKFHVNSQPLELTTSIRDNRLFANLTGTDLSEQITDTEITSYSDIWEQELPSESDTVSRGEFLAYDIFRKAQLGESGWSLDELHKAISTKSLEERVRAEASQRYDEGYDRGVHDHDAAAILEALLNTYAQCGLLRHTASARAWAMLAWNMLDQKDIKESWLTRLRSHAERGRIFGGNAIDMDHVNNLKPLLEAFAQETGLPFARSVLAEAAEFLYSALLSPNAPDFPASTETGNAIKDFWQELHLKNAESAFKGDLASLKDKPGVTIALAHSWTSSFLQSRNITDDGMAWEMAAFILHGKTPANTGKSVLVEVDGIRETHANVNNGKLAFRMDEFLLRLQEFTTATLPRFRKFRQARDSFLARRRQDLHLDDFRARTMGGFVRNRLINDVYLRFVGDNFAKQMGSAEKGSRTDQMGLLLLISPPGYGKTTLMEYVCSTLGLAFMRINGPAIGNRVLSLDPGEASNATSRREIEKLNLAFAMGNNVMVYLDDIQHLNPEFLQKFISLCDAQRKIEGVHNGRTRAFDLRGKKVAVVMAGNPYTENGGVFKVPDMLANRADTYNLGDISAANADAFAMSFLENAVTSNQALSAWQKQWGDTEDLPKFLMAVSRGTVEGIDFKHSYSPAELEDLLKVTGYLARVRSVILDVNRQYIASAAQQDEYRTEPPFRLQGSYRNMNRMAEKIFPVMTEAEVDQVIMDHYRNEAQTLTTGAEHNLLKFKEIIGALDEKETLRWEEIKAEFSRRQSLGGVDDSSDMGKVLAQLSAFSASLTQIRNSLERGFTLAGERIGKALAEQEPQPIKLDLAPLVETLRTQHLDLEPIAKALQNQKLDLSPLTEALQNQKLDLSPIADALKNQRIDLTPLVEAISGQQQDLTPLVEAISSIKPDFSPLLKALPDRQTKQQTALQAVMPPEYAKAWERQILILESLVPVMDNARELNSTLSKLQEWLSKK